VQHSKRGATQQRLHQERARLVCVCVCVCVMGRVRLASSGARVSTRTRVL
jgi:hypothetical protein